jgi:hypothetical protein
MSMKRLMVLATLAASVTGCVANQGDAPVRFLGARALKSESGGCGLADLQLAQGSLDISGGGSYLLGVNVETNNISQPIVINGETFSGPGLSDINMREVVLTYQSQPSITLPMEERIPYYAVFRPGTSSTGSFALMYAIGPKALEALRASVGVGETVTVLSTIKAVGQFSGGAPVETNKITFPIVVYNSGFNPQNPTMLCPVTGQQPVGYWGPCNQVGQDTGPICAVPPPVSAP